MILLLNNLAWNNLKRIGVASCNKLASFQLMIDRDGWGHIYLVVRGEICGSTKEKQMRRRLSRTFSLIKS